nr:amidohydrolase family protein [Clostridiales bacterium]
LIRKAKKEGVNITCETAPHYLILCDKDLKEDGRFKMNPPLRSQEDRAALIEGICDGTIDMISTDHAPHSEEEKSRGLKGSAFGIVGIETSFQLLYTYLVKKGIISFDRLIELMAINPRKRFNIPLGNDDFTVWSLECESIINPDDFLSQGKSTPFEGFSVAGRCILTVSGGKTVYMDKESYERQ